MTATWSRSGPYETSPGETMTKWPTTSPTAQTGSATTEGAPPGAAVGAGPRRPLLSTTAASGGRGSALKSHSSAANIPASSSATAPTKTTSSSPCASLAAASLTRSRWALTERPCRRALDIRSATSPVRSPTTTSDTAVATSPCLAIEKRSYGWVSK